MSKRKTPMASKHAHSPRIAAKAQRAAIVRSPKDSVLRSGGAGSNKPPPKRRKDSQQSAVLVESPERLVEPKTALQPETALQDDSKRMMDNNSKNGNKSSLANANVRAYQTELLEFAQANMLLSFEFAQRLATMRSPTEFPGVIAEFTSRRIAVFRKHSPARTH
jgi:hypothetical protein